MLLVATWAGLVGAAIRAIDLIDVPVSIIGLIGIFGFAYKSPILRAFVWRIWVIAQPLWDVAYNLVGGDGDIKRTAIVFVIAAPGYLAIFLYGYRSRRLWSEFVFTRNEETV